MRDDDHLISEIVQLRVFVLDKRQSALLDEILDKEGLGGYEAGIETTDYHGGSTGWFRLLRVASEGGVDNVLDKLKAAAEELLEKHYAALTGRNTMGFSRRAVRPAPAPSSDASSASVAAEGPAAPSTGEMPQP
jgi:hypothetical protein